MHGMLEPVLHDDGLFMRDGFCVAVEGVFWDLQLQTHVTDLLYRRHRLFPASSQHLSAFTTFHQSWLVCLHPFNHSRALLSRV
jgi:hypothetical protein